MAKSGVFLLVSATGFVGAFLLACGLNWFALRPWRRSANQHWTERARLLHPARSGAKINIYLIPVTAVLAGKVCGIEAGLDKVWLGLASWLGAVLGTYPFDHEVLPWMRWQDWLHSVVANWTFLFLWLGLLIVAALLMPNDVGWEGLLLFALVSALQVWLNLGLWISLLKLFRVVQPANERLIKIVNETAGKMGLPLPRVYLLKLTASYAAALPINRILLFSPRLLELHPDEEIAAICAHELAHLTESRLSSLFRILPALAFLPLVFMKPAIVSQDEILSVAPIVAFAILYSTSILVRRFARRMEVRADRVATENQVDEGVYARALERLYESNQFPAVMPRKRMTHPHLYDRLLAAGITPAYPRPKPPLKGNLTLCILGPIMVVLFSLL